MRNAWINSCVVLSLRFWNVCCKWILLTLRLHVVLLKGLLLCCRTCSSVVPVPAAWCSTLHATRVVAPTGPPRPYRAFPNSHTSQWNWGQPKERVVCLFRQEMLSPIVQMLVPLPDSPVPVTIVARWGTRNLTVGPSMGAQGHVGLQLPCML